MDNSKKIKSIIEKIVVNAGIGKISQEANFKDKIYPKLVSDLSMITSQKPAATVSKRSIAGFKMRQGQIVGLKVTLRGQRMVDFFEKLVKIVLPRVRDFKGISLKSVDSSGNLSIGFKDQYPFPEISVEETVYQLPLEVVIVTKAKNKEAAIKELTEIGVPLVNKNKK
jgi:large subunit ribosomal protein L5